MPEIQFTAVTIRRFASEALLAEFMEYLKGHLPPDVHYSLMTTGHAKLSEVEAGTDLKPEAIVHSQWMIQKVPE